MFKRLLVAQFVRKAAASTTSSTTSALRQQQQRHYSKTTDKHKGKRQKKQKAPDMFRNWVPNTTQQVLPNQKHYKLVSYNILAQDLLAKHMHLYYNTHPALLRWEQRLCRISSELMFLQPDILCLQELQYDHIADLIKTLKWPQKLEYLFKKTTGNQRPDGCAIIYNSDKFQLLADEAVEYYKPNVHTLDRNNVAIMAKFNLKEQPNKHIVVATTHLLWNPKRSDVRNAQVQVLRERLTAFASANQAENQLHLPVILTGDFNFIKNSLPYQTLTQQQNEQTAAAKDTNFLQLQAVDFGTDIASTYQNEWINVDHIFYGTGAHREQVQIMNVYQLPTVENCCRMGAIPNCYSGSDHYSLAVMFSVP